MMVAPARCAAVTARSSKVVQSNAQPASAATGLADLPQHLQALLDRKQRLLAGMDPDRDDQPVARPHGVPDHVQMAVGDGVEGAGIKRDTGHGPVYPAPGGPASRAGSRQAGGPFTSFAGEPLPGLAASSIEPTVFRRNGHETKLRPDETIFGLREDVRKPAPCISRRNKAGHKGPMTGDRHDQGSFCNCCRRVCRCRPYRSSRLCPAGRSQRSASPRQGRPAGYPPGRPDCSEQAWPNFEASCLRVAGSKTMIREARLVTVERTR